MERPHLCPDETCNPLYCNYDRRNFDKGYSYFCWGKIKKEHVFVAGEVEHKNQFHQCIYTPLKGHIVFFITTDDAWTDFLGSCTVMDFEEELVCDECGPISRASSNLHAFPKEGTKLCSKCAVRLGKLTWHPEKKRYWYEST
ncbi:MAG: hypothetical protein AM326_03100 [Candidatus Thorarchaeota archaeon SMTZ-45]|nr:MAG: hypothetical protein AM326_03100 [Candidatus Thorarchaeota archaeon SMTZ-45]